MEEVKVFLTEREIGGHLYGEHICARSLAEAQEFAARAGVRLLGELEETLCANCLARIGGSAPTTSPNDWDETIDA